MNCKFHPTAEAVTKCAVCDAGMCSSCAEGASFKVGDSQYSGFLWKIDRDVGASFEVTSGHLCLECSLKKAENDYIDKKNTQKKMLRDGVIASVIWIVGVCLTSVIGGFGLFIMLVASIVFYGLGGMFVAASGFFVIIKNVALGTLFLPIIAIVYMVGFKMDVKKANKDVRRIDDEITTILKSRGAKTQSEIEAAKVAAEKGRKERVKKHYMLNEDLLTAIQKHERGIMESLISQGADVNYHTSVGNTPLTFAIQANDMEIIKFLLESGADAWKKAYAKDMGYINAIDFARIVRKEDIAEFLERS